MDWETIRIFITVAQTRSIRTSALQIGCSIKTVRSHLESLENMVGALLFARDSRGAKLTETGQIIYERSLDMLRGAQALRSICIRGQSVRRSVNIGCSEGIGTFWLLPRIVDFYDERIRLRLNIDPKPHDVKALEVDLSIQFDQPQPDPEITVVRLCSVHVVLFASEGYIARRGAPVTRADLARHHVLEISAAQIATDALALDELGDPRSFIDLSVNTASSQLIAARRGVGITAFPTFTVALAPELRHVAKDWALKRDLWLAYNTKAAEFFHVRKTIDWIRRAFDPTVYPWFAEPVMTPESILTHVEKSGMRGLFDGYGHYAMGDVEEAQAC
jgi:DNA-binding transcriptional LysR family regulator